MGWDAFAKQPNGESAICAEPDGIMEQFERASEAVAQRCGAVDGSLEHGVLDVSTTGEALSDVTGRSVYDPEGWDVDEVQKLYDHADFNSIGQDDLYVESAREFLRICAENDLQITFSW